METVHPNIEKIYEDLSFDRDHLDAVWAVQPKLLMRYGVELARAERILADAKRELDATEAGLYDATRKNLAMSGVKFTETSLEARVRNTVQYQAKRQAYDRAQEDATIYRIAVDALRHRRDMIVQASKFALAELEHIGSGTFNTKRN